MNAYSPKNFPFSAAISTHMLRVFFIRRSVHRGMSSHKSDTFLKIGEVRVPVASPKNAELVPAGFADTDVPQGIVQTIKWLLKKDLLRQDVFLIGAPGILRSQIAFQFLELCNREFEYLPISRDTTEADIKQRREIQSGNVFYSDLCAVKAALNGRVLIIDGVEKAERNVLPILNNLLENREMQLDDGRFLMSASKYDKMLKKYSEQQLREWKLERVSPDFQVIALGLPVPTFHGHTLDPPLRSRFQCRNVTTLSYSTTVQLAHLSAPNVAPERLSNLLALVYALHSQNQKLSALEVAAVEETTKSRQRSSLSSESSRSHRRQIEKETELDTMPLFPMESVLRAVRIWNNNSDYSEEAIFEMCYPSGTVLKAGHQQNILQEFFTKFLTKSPSLINARRRIASIVPTGNGCSATAQITGVPNHFEVPIGKLLSSTAGDSPQLLNNTHHHKFVSTDALEQMLSDLLLTHSQSDFCVLGARGSGKSVLIREFASRLGYPKETMILYQDMNSRELLQQRRILPNGDTVWEDSQLVRAAKCGHLCVLDGLERVHWSVLEMLATLIHHRFLQLPDGTRLLGEARYALLKERCALSDKELAERKIYKIGQSFRLVGLGDAVSADSPTAKWLNEQVLPLFLYHTLRPLPIDDELRIVSALVPNVCHETARRLLTLTHHLRKSKDLAVASIVNSLSLRRLIFLLRRHSLNPSEGVYAAVERAALARFMPTLVRDAFEDALRIAAIQPPPPSKRNDRSLSKDDLMGRLINGRRSAEQKTSLYDEAMVPDIVFYDNKQHLSIMEDMSKDFELGSHLLLIGNQGVGKNKVVDRFLQLINHPRQYMQLHRDTTVQSLTVQTTVANGRLSYEDSPLVKAVRQGLVLVVDEADKAPLHVIAVLKSLLDSGVLYLSDGRVIRPENDGDSNTIRIHPDFRIVMLANRPGFPFLGNDLFATLGDLFSVHIVDNPVPDSELVMLKNYGPDVPESTLKALVAAFGDLREMADQSLLTYPYSTRELVNIVRHVQRFPADPIGDVIHNVFDFDAYSQEVVELIRSVFEKRGFRLGDGSGGGGWWGRLMGGGSGDTATNERIEFEKSMSQFDASKLNAPKIGKVDPDNTPHVGGNTWAGGTGGYNTAGLGGVGGPFRLDAGHNVHQMPDEAKKQVPEHILKKARELAQQEYAKRLKEIEMSDYDANAYNELYEKIGKQVKMFRTMVDSLEAREHERQWAKHQTSGDFDDGKLIEGMTGEKTIYRRRIDQPPDPSVDLQKPKRLRLVFDVSGSMYRFNGLDQRLQRSLESALLVMESFEGKQDKIKYDIYGHSGESAELPFVRADNLPTNEKQKLDVLKRMLAHTQFCWSGDHTIPAIYRAIREIKEEQGVDERFVVILSDANLDRYQIRPADVKKALTSDESVNAFLILIGSLGSQAINIQQALPRGKAFVASDASEIPQIMQKIFSSTIMK